MDRIDALISARWIVPVEPETAVLEDHCLAVHEGRILAVLRCGEAEARFEPRQRFSLDHHAVLPGLVNAHTHAAMTLLRGLADDMPLPLWLNEHIWPAEQRWVSEEFVHDGTQLAVAEMLRGGVTCFNDMYFFPEVTARTASAAGMRAVVGLILIDFPTVYAQDAEAYISRGLSVHDQYRSDPLISTAFAPHAPYSVSDAPLARVRVLADELDVPVHIHVHETAHEIETSLEQFGERPLVRLDRLELVSPALLAVHLTQLDDAEIDLLAERGARAVHCPESNMKLASGLCPVARLEAAGITVGLGTDGAASNNDLDVFGEMRTAALLAKIVSEDAAALPAHRALRMATLGGATALGLGEETGSLVPGKWADICAVELDRLESQPLYNIHSQLVYATGRHQVSDVWVAGQHLLRDGRLTTLDEDAILSRAHEWRQKIQGS